MSLRLAGPRGPGCAVSWFGSCLHTSATWEGLWIGVCTACHNASSFLWPLNKVKHNYQIDYSALSTPISILLFMLNDSTGHLLYSCQCLEGARYEYGWYISRWCPCNSSSVCVPKKLSHFLAASLTLWFTGIILRPFHRLYIKKSSPGKVVLYYGWLQGKCLFGPEGYFMYHRNNLRAGRMAILINPCKSLHYDVRLRH